MQVYMGGIVPTYSVGWRKNSCMAIFLAGCDFNCVNCHNLEIKGFKEDNLVSILEIKKEINLNCNNVDTIFFGGAEPCLQRQALLSLSRHAKNIGLKIGLGTNGTSPSTIKSLIHEKLIDFIEIKIFSDFSNNNFEKITKSKNFFKSSESILQSIYETFNIIKKEENKISIAFRTKIIPSLNDDFEILSRIADKIKNINALWILENDNETNNKQKLDNNYNRTFFDNLKKKIENKHPEINVEIDYKEPIDLDNIE